MKETSYSPTGMLLAASSLPSAAQRAAAGIPEHASIVASAPLDQFDPIAFTSIYTPKLDARSASNMVRRAPNADCLDHVVAIGERRQSVIAAIFEHWALGPQARTDLTTSKMHAATADTILTRAEFSDSEKLRAARYASDENVIGWLATGVELDDDTVIDLLVAARPATAPRHDRVWIHLARLAYLHPGICPWLAADADYGPAASVMALTEESGLALCNNARGPLIDESRARLWAYALCNLIDHPATSETVRERAMGAIDNANHASTRRRHGVGTSAFVDAASLADPDPDTIERLLTVAIPESGYMPASRLFVLADIATSATLTADQAIRLMYRMSHYECGPVLGKAFMRVCHERLAVIASQVADAKEVKDMIRAYSEDHYDFTDTGCDADATHGTVRRTRHPTSRTASYASEAGPIEQIMVLPGFTTWRGGLPLGGRPDDAVKLLTGIVGDNEQAWQVLLGIADTFNGTVSELGEAAGLL